MISTLSFADPQTDLANLLNHVQSMQANFQQTIYDNRGKAVQQAVGRIALERPNRFRWQVIKPIPQLIVANQSTLWVYDSDLQQVTIRTLKQASDDAPALLLSHDATQLLQKYTVKALSPTNAKWQWFELRPKMSSNFVLIKLGFHQRQIQVMDLVDQLGHTTRIQFLNPRFNMKLSSALFTFKPPAHVDVIHETR
jgi:outer membrane lipoprotein carrier protein